MPDRLEGALRCPVVVGDLGRVYFVGEPDPHFVKDVEDGVPPVRKVLVPGVDHLFGGRREHRHVLPDGRPGKPGDRFDAELGGEPGGVLQFLGCPTADPFRIAVAPDNVRQDAAVPFVDGVVTDRLALEVVGDGPYFEAVAFKDVQLALHIGVVVPAPRVQVVTPAGNLQPVVPPLAGEPGHLLKRQVGPLAGKQGNWSCHVLSLPYSARTGTATRIQAESFSELRSTASSTRCTLSPSAKVGCGSVPATMPSTRSLTWWENPCS